MKEQRKQCKLWGQMNDYWLLICVCVGAREKAKSNAFVCLPASPTRDYYIQRVGWLALLNNARIGNKSKTLSAATGPMMGLNYFAASHTHAAGNGSCYQINPDSRPPPSAKQPHQPTLDTAPSFAHKLNCHKHIFRFAWISNRGWPLDNKLCLLLVAKIHCELPPI
jgi:hypothetical protein